MTFSEEYIKMVLALPDEFFKDWKYNNGDSILEYYDGKWNVHYIGDREIEDNEIGTIQGWECEFYSDDGIPTRPLPNQEQLQNMVDPDWKTAYGTFYKYTYLHPIKTDSVNELWLIMLMDIKYHIKWNGIKWL